MSVRAGVVGLNLNPVLTLCLFDGLSEGIAGFLISIWISVSNPWLLVGTCHSGDDVAYALIDEAGD